ncbi:MAG: hypothetical protein J6D29_09230 [Solobacterium sp.]|nr:hypothetical protein [Solobacterium sp.]
MKLNKTIHFLLCTSLMLSVFSSFVTLKAEEPNEDPESVKVEEVFSEDIEEDTVFVMEELPVEPQEEVEEEIVFVEEEVIEQELSNAAYPQYQKSVHLKWLKEENNKYYWYENGVRQGTYNDPKGVMGDGTIRGREIYDPSSDAWYWLDSVYRGAKALNKEVWIPYIYQDEKPGSTGGKWVRYDRNGAMIKGWYKNSNGTYYYDLITGAMYKGYKTIDNARYHFDETTGIMTKGFFKKDGTIVYYNSNGKQQFGQKNINGNWYMFDVNTGVMVTGFFDHTYATDASGNKTVYYDPNGKMVYGDVTINGIKYHFDETTGALTSMNNFAALTELPRSNVNTDLISRNGSYYSYPGATLGIDVSVHQGVINWQAVRNAGVEFVFIRVGYRGYTAGGIYKDNNFEDNYWGAKNAGLKVGVYFFSQAINTQEAIDEANFVLENIRGKNIDLEVVYDLEEVESSLGRANNLTKEDWTNQAMEFSHVIKSNGFEPMVYTNLYWARKYFDLNTVMNYPIWLAQYNTIPTFPYQFKYWQYSSSGRINGISGNVDMNLWFK